jgi:hypothetical protein
MVTRLPTYYYLLPYLTEYLGIFCIPLQPHINTNLSTPLCSSSGAANFTSLFMSHREKKKEKKKKKTEHEFPIQ